jgi:hypothetical protein
MSFDHFGFATVSPKSIRKYFAQDRGETEKTARHDGRNSVKPRGDVVSPVRGRGGHQKGRGRPGASSPEGDNQ